jgi:hypothetical protein
MPRSMGWFRSNAGKIAWLAFFALACHFVFTFGHVHFVNLNVASVASVRITDAADNLSDHPGSPAPQTPAPLARDLCAVCNAISFANALILPAIRLAVAPISAIRDLHWSRLATELAPRDHFHFSARGPPTSDLAT